MSSDFEPAAGPPRPRRFAYLSDLQSCVNAYCLVHADGHIAMYGSLESRLFESHRILADGQIGGNKVARTVAREPGCLLGPDIDDSHCRVGHYCSGRVRHRAGDAASVNLRLDR